MDYAQISDKQPTLHKSPQLCSGSTCPKKNCLRVVKDLMFGEVNQSICIRHHYAMLIETDTPEGAEFVRQRNLYAQEQQPFKLNNERYQCPTDTTMYDCLFCLAAGRKHQIENKPTPPELRENWDWVTKFWPSHIRVCSGCGRYDGPWVPYGDD